MSYSEQTWADGPGGGTPINAARLQHMEDGLSQVALWVDQLAEQGVGKMMHAFVPAGHFYVLSTQVIAGWQAPTFMVLDAIGSYLAAPFTGAPAYLPTPNLDTWQQNTTGGAVYLNLMAAMVGEKGQNGHMYLITSVDGTPATYIRQDFLALRTGVAGS